MKLIILLTLFSTSLFSQDSKKEEIKKVVMDYIESWYSGDTDRMKQALHPDLAKRIVKKDKKTGKEFLEKMGAEKLIGFVKKGFGKKTPKEMQFKNIEILDVLNGIATVKAEMSYWYDYMHIAKFKDEWKIVNVLWEMKKQN